MVRGEERRVETLTTAKTANTPTHIPHAPENRAPARAPVDRFPCQTSVPGLPMLVREEKWFQLALPEAIASRLANDDDEFAINPPTPCQIGKHPPAPKKSGRPARGARWRASVVKPGRVPPPPEAEGPA